MLKKRASTQLLEAMEHPRSGLIRSAARHEFSYQPRPGMIYVRSRMISSRVNDNWDGFPADEIEKGWRSFIGKPVFVNHHNEDHRRARGVIIDAVLHHHRNRDGSPDTWVEGLQEIDALTFPKLAQRILKRDIERTSMGVDVDYSICSACGNKATDTFSYCQHIPGMKGRKFYRSGKKGRFIFETCYGLRFFENSLLVEDPADPTAFFVGDVQTGPGLEHMTAGLTRTAAKDYESVSVPEELRPRFEGVSLAQDEGGYFVHTHRARSDSYDSPEAIPQKKIDFIESTGARMRNAGPLWSEAARYSHPSEHPWFQANPVHHDHIIDHWNQATDDEKEQGKRWYPDAHLVAKSIAKLAPVRPEKAQDHADYLRANASFEERRAKAQKSGKPMPDESERPKEPHDLRHPLGDAHLGASMLAIYSPQQGWAGNMHNAARVLHEGKGIGGKGSGMFASAAQAKSADVVLKGGHMHEAVSGPKIRDFGHLIEHGGDEHPVGHPEHQSHVVIDRHALGVATGKRLSNEDYGSAPVAAASRRKDGTIPRSAGYDHVVNAYHEAGKRISEQEGEHIPGHAVQATTWLVRQRLNQEAEKGATGNDVRLNQGRERARSNAEQGWADFAQQHGIEHAGPGTGYVKNSQRRVAYGETMAPPKVDTLRDENCPICGEDDAYDGHRCSICGYVAPPSPFNDPDLDMASKIDLREQQEEFGNSQIPNAERMTEQSTGLICDNCGTEFPEEPAETVDTDEPAPGVALEETEAGEGAAEGDVCPACGKGVLESQADLEEEGIEPDSGEEDEGPQWREDEGDEEEPPGVPVKSSDGQPADDDEDDDEDDEDEDEEDDQPVSKDRSKTKR